MQYQLNIKVLSKDPKVLEYYKNYELTNDSGIDLIIPENGIVKLGETFTIDHLIQCSMTNVNDNSISSAYWLVPRSSISKTNFRMANSIGLIDSGYRGNIKAKVDLNTKLNIDNDGKITVNKTSDNIVRYSRMFQIATPDLSPIVKINIVEELDATSRGAGAFGSTGI
jgi:dUTP pyrophosphatase